MEITEQAEVEVIRPDRDRLVAVDDNGNPESYVSIDGASFDLDRGSWVAPVPPRARGLGRMSDAPDGCVSVDGALFRVEPS